MGRRREGEVARRDDNIFWKAHRVLTISSTVSARGYRDLLASALDNRKTMAVGFGALCAVCVALMPFIGTDFFPQVDAGQIRLHVRAPTDTRIEETEQSFSLHEGHHSPHHPAR